MRKVVRLLSFFAALVVLSTSLGAEPASHRSALRGHYFVMVWGFQGQDNDVVHSHTFASFYKGDDLSKGIIKPVTISWLPATGVIDPFAAEPGHNFTLAQTLEMACRLNREVKSWGPYAIEPALYQRAVKRVRLLNSGRVQYSMIDTAPRTMNCIDAAGDLTPTPLDTGIAWGFVASDAVVQHLSPYFIHSGRWDQTLKNMIARNACPEPALAN